MRHTGLRDEVIATSASLFAQRGLAGTSMRMIAQACGIQAASLYHHFSSKDDLVAEILTLSTDHVVGLYADIVAADLEPVARFEALIRATLDNFHQHDHAAQIFYDNPAYVANAVGLQRVRDAAAANDRLWDRTIGQAISTGALRSDISPARLKVLLRNMIWSTTRGLRRGKQASEVADEIVTLLLHGCLVSAASCGSPRTGPPTTRPDPPPSRGGSGHRRRR